MVTGGGRWEERERLSKRDKQCKAARREAGRLDAERDERARLARHLRDRRREVERLQAERQRHQQRAARRARELRDPLLQHLIQLFNDQVSLQEPGGLDHVGDLVVDAPQALEKMRGLCDDVRHALTDPSVDTVPLALDIRPVPPGALPIYDIRVVVKRGFKYILV